MELPESLWQGSAEAREALSQRFALPNTPDMQDWEWQVADSGRIDEFLEAYETEDFPDGERFLLMEMLLESFEELAATVPLAQDSRWQRLLPP